MKKYPLVCTAYLFVLIFNVCLTVYFFSKPPLYVLHLGQTSFFEVWPSLSIKNSRWLIVFGVIVISFIPLLLSSISKKEKCSSNNSSFRWLFDSLLPLSLLPLACVPLLVADKLTAFWNTNAPFFFLLIIISIVLTRFLSPLLDHQDKQSRGTIVWAVLILLFSLTVYATSGFIFSSTVGEHVGDEGHYLIQAHSLYEDGDLDLKNNILDSLDDQEDPATVCLFNYHIAPNSRNGAWYSWHPYGLSVLLAPTTLWGLTGRHIALGFISGLGLAGLFLLCRRMGSGTLASLLAVLSLGTSVYWGLYSMRALPEVLGGTLAIWTFWAIATQQQRPWLTLLVAAACCVFMPFAQTRFVPVSLMGIGLYGLFGLLGHEPLKTKLFRLSAFTLLCIAGYGLYLAIQTSMFSGGGSYPIRETLFSYPIGAWAVLASDRGLVSIFPVFLWLAGAMVIWFITDKANRLFCLGIAATFLACLLTSNTYPGYTGGSSLPGRYLVVVVPLLFVAAAVMLERADRIGRGCFFCLSLFSTMLLFSIFLHMENVGRAFILPIHRLSSFPLFQSLYFPHAAISQEFSQGAFWTTVYTLIAFLGMLMILFFRFRRKFFSIVVLLVIVAIGVHAMNLRGHMAPNVYTYFQTLPISEAKYLELFDPFSERHPWAISFDLDRFHGFTGEREWDPEEAIVMSRIALQGQHEPGMMLFGRNRYVFPGLFSAEYDVGLHGENSYPIATMDISMDEGRHILASIEASDNGNSSEVVVDFEAQGFWIVEPRIYYHGTGDIALYGLTIREKMSEGGEALPKLAFYRVPIEAVRHIFPFYLNQIQMKNRRTALK
jgi:hypothetical protein